MWRQLPREGFDIARFTVHASFVLDAVEQALLDRMPIAVVDPPQ
jgi:hypothetical protein